MFENNFCLKENSVWIMYCSENNEPYFSKFVTNKTIVPAVAILSNNTNFLIVHSLDYCNVSDFEGTILQYSGENSLINTISDVLKILKYPSEIYMNFSDKMDSQIDIIGYGTFRFLSDNILGFYKKSSEIIPSFKSADEIIYKLMDSKTSDDIKYLKIAASRALEILNIAFKKIKPGMTEKQISNVVHNIFKFKPNYFRKYGIVKEELSWEKELCPVVLVGKNLKKGGHSCASDTVFKRGDTIYFDFGIKIFLSNGKKYSSDIQRMGYALKQGEKSPPENVKRVFDTLVQSVKLGIENFLPSNKGFEVDNIVRKYILSQGYPDYNHATGHPIGEEAHSPGTSISPKGNKRSSFLLQENGVYTIEPRIQIENGGSIEEMVQVTKKGGIPLCPPQKTLYLIK